MNKVSKRENSKQGQGSETDCHREQSSGLRDQKDDQVTGLYNEVAELKENGGRNHGQLKT